jgi:patatin-like phospholipase/acyl hydrolase
MVKEKDDNNLLDTLKKHSQFKKCWILKLWNFKFSKNIYHMYMGYNVHDVLNKVVVLNIKLNFKKLTFFGMISNYHHFSRWNIGLQGICTFL